jgi:hypothetical protein
LSREWCIPPQANAAFVAQMEAVLEVYTRPFDPRRPLVCFDESSKQLTKEVAVPLPPAPGQPARYDTEYERNGVAALLLAFAPLHNWRHVDVRAQRTAVEVAHCLRDLVDVHFPNAERVTLVVDNLNTHTPAALYAAFPPAEARRIAAKLEWCYTPKHGSWLNMAEIEFSILSRQCLDRRLPDQATLAAEVAAWEAARNASRATVHWRFTTADARIKLKHLYPVLEPINS